MIKLFMMVMLIFIFFHKAYSIFKKTRENYRNDNKHFFEVQLANTKKGREYGLMFLKKKLKVNQGMLFDYKKLTKPSIWMKNTYIPLDAIFIDKKGKVVYLKENLKPKSLKSHKSKKLCQYVLEVNGGTVKKLGIKEGHYIGTTLKKKTIS